MKSGVKMTEKTRREQPNAQRNRQERHMLKERKRNKGQEEKKRNIGFLYWMNEVVGRRLEMKEGTMKPHCERQKTKRAYVRNCC